MNRNWLFSKLNYVYIRVKIFSKWRRWDCEYLTLNEKIVAYGNKVNVFQINNNQFCGVFPTIYNNKMKCKYGKYILIIIVIIVHVIM